MVDPEFIQMDTVIITGDDFKHLCQVLRLNTGDGIFVFDGSGMEYRAEIISISKHEARARIIDSKLSDTEPSVHVTLFQGLPKAEKMDLIIQKSVELGVHRIFPVITQYSVVQVTREEGEKKAVRWNRIAREASKQCRRACVPEVLAPVSMEKAISSLEQFPASMVFYENAQKKCLKEVLKCYNINKIKDIALFIGPEGGFSEAEIRNLSDRNVQVASLGKRILRTETAAISALSIIMYEMGEMET